MATRLYLPSSGTAPLASLAYDSNWEQSTGLVRLPCSITKSDTALTDSVRTWASATTQQWVWWQFQSAMLAEGYSWTTSDTVSLVIRGLEANTACDSHVVYSVRVVSADGSTVRGTVGLYHATSTEFTTSALTRIHNARTTGATNFTSYAGDRIIIELGLHGVTPSTSYTNTMRIGDPTATSDFALTAGLTTDLCPWVQLSRDVIFGNARMTATITTGGANTVSGTLSEAATGGAIAGATDGVAAVSGTLQEQATSSPIKGLVGYGSDTVLNGGFDSNSDWTLVQDCTITGGVLSINCATTAEVAYQTWTGIQYRYYRIAFDLVCISGTLRICLGSSGNSTIHTTSGHKEYILYTEIDPQYNIQIRVDSGFVGTIDNFEVQLQSNTISTVTGTLSESSAGTVEYISNVVLGTEKVLNGGFDSGASWGLGTGWTISGGTLNATAAALGAQTYQNVGITQATRYRISFVVSNYSSGYLNFLIGASYGSPNRDFNANGSYSYNVTSLPDSINGYLYVRPVISAPLNVSVDNVSLKPLTVGCNGVATVSGTLNKKRIAGFVHATSDNFDSYPDGVYLDSLPEWINIRSGVAPDALRITKTAGDGEVRFIGNGSAAYFYTRRGVFNNDQFVQFTLTAFNVNLPAAIVRGSEATNVTCYMWRSEYSSAYLIRRVNGTETNLITNGSVWSAGDVIRFEVKGSTLYFYRNGVLDTSMNGGSYTDTSPIASGSPGIAGYDSQASYTQIDDWSGGNFVSTVSGTLSEGVPATTLIGSAAGVASVAGVLTGLSNIREIVGSAAGVASVTGSAIRKARLSGVIGSKQIVADHTSVRKYIDIPQSYIDEVKKMWLSYAGESHSAAVRIGLTNLETAESKYAVSVIESGTPEAYTTANLRANRATWGDLNNATGWIHGYGEEDWYTSETARTRTKAGLDYCHNNGPALAAFGFGWCWDPDEQQAAMATYNAATQEYEDHCRTNGYLTKVFFTTGPVDATNASGIVGYYKYLSYEIIRAYVAQNKGRILFDYADILCYDNDGSGPNTAEYDGHTFPIITAANALPDQVGHISNVGALRLAKAMWWMLARMSGWQSQALQVTVSGTLTEKAANAIAGAANGVAVVSGTLRATGQIYTSSSGVALVAGTLNGRGLLQGAISTNGTVSGLLLGLGRLAVSVNAIASVVGRLSSSGVFAGHIGGVASVSGSLSATVNISASINAAANVTGALKGSIIATSSGVSTVTGRILATANLVITSSGVSLVSGTLKADGRLTTHITSTTSLTGILRAKGRLATLINTQAVVSADLDGRGRLTGISQGVTTCSAIPVLATQAGIINGVALVSGTLRAKGRLSASINLYPIVSAHINGWFRLSTVITCSTNVLGLLLGKSHLSGTIAGVNSVSGLLLAKANLVGVITNINTSSAILRGNGSLIAQINIAAILNATLLGEGRLTGLSEGIPLVWGAMREYVPPSALLGNILTYSEVSGNLWDAANVYRTFRGSVSMLGVKAQVINEDTGVKATLDTGDNVKAQIE